MTLECLQGLSGYRTFEVADMVANTIGVLLGLALTQTPLDRILRSFEEFLLRTSLPR